jgi:long-chain acyl-CoA synthetase
VIDPRPPLPMAMFDAAVARLGERPLLYSFETPISGVECGRLVAGLAAGLARLGVGRGDRIGLFMQNDPQFVIASLAVWRLGAITVPANPMLRSHELARHLADAGATGLIVLDDLLADVAAASLPETRVAFVVRTAAFDFCDERPSLSAARPDSLSLPVHDFLELARTTPNHELTDPGLTAGDAAVLTYTSGTTGPPKGAINTHGQYRVRVRGLPRAAGGRRFRRDPRDRAALSRDRPHRSPRAGPRRGGPDRARPPV